MIPGVVCTPSERRDLLTALLHAVLASSVMGAFVAEHVLSSCLWLVLHTSFVSTFLPTLLVRRRAHV